MIAIVAGAVRPLAGWKSPTVWLSLRVAVSARSLAALAVPGQARWLRMAPFVPFSARRGRTARAGDARIEGDALYPVEVARSRP